jgi:hypothetical protein
MAAAIAAMTLAGAAHAQPPVDLQVVDRESGQALPVWRHHGRLYVAGRPGARYGLRVTNHTGGRVQVVMSVDGVNIVSGETAGWDQTGYILHPYQSYEVDGWRKSTTEVADFTFAPLSRSYAARTGRPADVGVIGVAVFAEKGWVPTPPPEPEARAVPRRSGSGAAERYAQRGTDEPAAQAPPIPPPPPPPPPAAAAVTEPLPSGAARSAPADKAGQRLAEAAQPAPRDEKLGTGHGAREVSVVQMVDFERATQRPEFIEEVEYDTYVHLVAAGVIHPYAEGPRHPRPFPTNPDGRWVPDPPDDR